MSILSVVNIAAEAMKTQQQAIQTAGHNLANVATPGFSRQRVEFSSAVPGESGGVTLGRGVEIDGITSVVDKFLESELLSLNGTLGFTEAENRALSGLEDAFPVAAGIGVEAALDAFFTAFSDLSNNPAGQAERVSLVNASTSLGNTLRETRATLTTLQTNLDKDLEAAVSRVNAIVPLIASLNQQIVSGESLGEQANDFRDQRQVLLQELSHLTGATTLEGSDGQVTVILNGLLLVSGDRSATLDDTNLNSSGHRLVFHKNPGGVSFDATSMYDKGEIGGILAMRDTEVVNIIGRLDQLAKSLVDTINTQHALGFDLSGIAGDNFFDPIGVVAGAAAIVKVTSTVVSDLNLIAAAQDASGVPGDNRNALALVNLQDTKIVALGNLTLNGYFLSLVGDVGAKAQSSEDNARFQASLLSQTQIRRDGISAVNMDEEMTKLILFQRAFEAAALLVRTGDEMYQAILEMVR